MLNDIQNQIDNITKIAFEDGMNLAWEAARRIVCPPDCCEDGLAHKVKEIFGYEGYMSRGVFKDFTASEVLEKIKEYEEKGKTDDEIKVGDEVDHDGLKCIVVKVWQDCVCTISQVGTTPSYTDKSVLKKTGRHFDEIEKLMKKIGVDDE